MWYAGPRLETDFPPRRTMMEEVARATGLFRGYIHRFPARWAGLFERMEPPQHRVPRRRGFTNTFSCNLCPRTRATLGFGPNTRGRWRGVVVNPSRRFPTGRRRYHGFRLRAKEYIRPARAPSPASTAVDGSGTTDPLGTTRSLLIP